jgi:hypothetical protein
MEKKKKINGKNKGSSFERKLMNLFISLGWEKCKTARNESKTTDDSGVDLCNTHPFQIQAKAVESLGPLHPVLKRMPKEEGKINLVWHKRNNQGSVVAMEEADFLSIISMLIEAGKISPKNLPH